MERIVVRRSIVKLKSVDLFHFDTRTGGPAMLCLHGRFGRAETFADLIQRYGTQYRIIAPDQRGHGLSSKPVGKYTAEELAGDMVELLDFLDIDSAIVVGHSMGGRVAGYLAAQHPKRVRALAILDKSAGGPAKPSALPPEQIAAIDPVTKDWPLPFATLSEAMATIRRATDSDLSYQYFMNSLIETAEGYQMMFSSQAIAANIAYEQSWFHLLPSIKCPVALIRAKGSGAVSDADLAQMKTLIPHCIARDVDHPDHNVHLGNKTEFYRHFDEFLSLVKPV